MADSSYQKWSNNDTGQTPKDIKLIDNGDTTHSISVGASRNNPINAQITDVSGRSAIISTFGDLLVGTKKNNINVSFARNNGNEGTLESLKSTYFLSSGTGSQSNTDEVGFVETGTGVGYAEIRSKTSNRYIPGHGNECLHTMIFDKNEENVISWVGYGSLKGDNCLAFGYNYLTFGIWLRLRGVTSFIPQSEWSENTLDNLVPSFENIGGDSFVWLGVGDIDFYIFGENNERIHVHKHKTANKKKNPHLSEHTLYMSMGVERTEGTGENIKVGSSSWFAGTIGERANGTGSDKFPFVERTNISIPANVETVLLSVRNKDIFGIKENTIFTRYGTITLTADGTKPVVYRVYINAVDYDPLNDDWGDYDTDLSITQLNIDAPLNFTTRTPVPGLTIKNEQVGGTFSSKTGEVRINLFSTDVIIGANPGDIITFTAESRGNSTINYMQRSIEEN